MQQYSFDFADLDKLRDYYRSQLDPKSTSDRIYFPPEIGNGYLSYYKISENVFLLINNYKAHVDIEYNRRPIEEKDLILHFRKYALDHVMRGNEVISNYCDSYTPGNMRCMDAQFGERVFIPKGAEVKSTMIVLKSSYTASYLSTDKIVADKVESYIKYSHEHLNKLYLNYKQSKLFDQIVDPDMSKVMHHLYFIARGIRLLETFWKDVLQWERGSNPFGINSVQVGNIFNVTNYLENNLHEPFDGVDHLAAMAHMSRTNFFNIFKEIHNQTPLEFFNNKRLERSYNMIFTERCSVREVMDALNYSNSSKFKKAFFNKFDVFPEIRE